MWKWTQPLARGWVIVRDEWRSGDRHLRTQVDVLNGVEKGDTLRERLLERFAARDETHTAGALVDHSRHDSLTHITCTLGVASRVDEPDASHVAVGYLVACEIDRVIRRETIVHQIIHLPIGRFALLIQEPEAAVLLGQLLLDDIRLNGDAQVVGLAGHVS